MTINWDEIKKKAQARGAAAEQQVNFTRATPSLPKAPPKPLPTFQSVLDEYNTSLPGVGNLVAKNLAPERKQEIAQGTQRFFEQAPIQAGFMQGLAFDNPVKSLERKLGTQIDTSQAEKSGFYKAGEIGGIMTQFAIPYAGASKGIAAGLTKLPKYAQMGKLGQGVARSVAADLAVGLPLNVNYAFNKEGLRGTDAAKSIAINTGIDLIAGGILEAVPIFLKSGKKVASKAEFDILPPTEKAEAMSELERLAYESNVRKGKITPQGQTLYGNAYQPIAGELPAPIPKAQINAKSAPLQKADLSYKGSHEAPTNDGFNAPGYDLTQIYPADVYSAKGADYYGHRIPTDKKAIQVIQKIRNNPEAELTVYRAVPGGAPKTINRGDWITTTKEYAQMHGEHSLNGNYTIVERRVKAKDIFTNGDSIHEFGYDSGVDVPKTFSGKPSKLEPKIPDMYAAAKGQRETPFTVTRGEMSLPQASSTPAQPILPQKGAEIPKEQMFAKNGDLPTTKNNGTIPARGVDTVRKVDTTGQQINPQHAEILKDTKAKQKGKVARVYHGTIYGDFGDFKNDPLGQEAKRYARELSDYENKTTETVKNAMPWEPQTKLRQPEPPKPIKDSVFFFSDNKAVAETYTFGGAEDKKFVGEYYLNLKNPKIIDMKGRSFHDTTTGLKMEELIAQAKKEGYDGIIEKNVLDGRTYGENEQLGTNYVAFSPDQIVRADKTELNGLKKDLGADTFKGEKTIDELVNEFGALPKGEMPRAREVDIPKKTDYGETQQYARTLQESAIVDDTLYKDINEAISQGSFTKPTKSNKSAVEDANVTLGEGLDEAVSKFKSVLMSDKKPTSYDIALGNRTLQELQKAGRYDEVLDVAIDLSEMLSESGRTLQAARIAKRLSPEGRLMIASRVASKVSKKTGNKVKLSDDTVKLIGEAKTEKEVVEANQKAAVEIWNQTPPNWIDKVNSWRYMSMLFNPKTHMRNIVGNSIFVPVREFKNLIGAGLERALIKDGARTKAVLNPVKDKAIMDFASGDFQNVKALLKNEGKLDDHVRNLDAKVFNTKIIEGIRKLNLGALDAEDTWFMKFAYDSSLAQYMKANKLTPDKMVGETLESARKYAMNESLKATYRDFNALANIISKGKHTLASGKYGALGKAGGVALEGMIPFTKTPLNIVKRGVGYSPANLVRGIANLGRVKSGKVTATEAIDQLASGLSGTALLGLGTFLGYNNIVNGKEGEYKDKLYNYNQMLGSQNYSLNIDGKSYTLDWAAPLSMPFFVGVEISNAIKDNNADLATVLDAMTQISDPMVNLSMLKGINDIMTNNFEGIGQTAFDIGTGYAGQFNPTLFGQVARTADDTRRSTISTAETSTGRGIEKFARKQVAKLPIASQKLEPYVDLWGREQKSGNFAENFLSPGYFKSENVTKVDEELKSLVGKLDEETAKKILPTSTAYQYTIKSGGLPYRMTEKESTAYQKTRGQESYKGLNKLFASVQYRKMSEEEKVNAIQDVYSDAHQKAKYNYFDSKGLPVTLALDKNYQEKYKPVKHLVSDKQFYKAVELVQSAGTTDIQKAYAIASLGNANPKLFEAFGINTEAKEGYVTILQKVTALKDSGISADNYIAAKEAADINASGNVNKTEAVDYLNGRTDLTDYQKAAILQALVPGLKVKNNPYY